MTLILILELPNLAHTVPEIREDVLEHTRPCPSSQYFGARYWCVSL